MGRLLRRLSALAGDIDRRFNRAPDRIVFVDDMFRIVGFATSTRRRRPDLIARYPELTHGTSRLGSLPARRYFSGDDSVRPARRRAEPVPLGRAARAGTLSDSSGSEGRDRHRRCRGPRSWHWARKSLRPRERTAPPFRDRHVEFRPSRISERGTSVRPGEGDGRSEHWSAPDHWACCFGGQSLRDRAGNGRRADDDDAPRRRVAWDLWRLDMPRRRS